MSKINKGGRPIKRIDWKIVEAMLSGGSTGSDIADALGMSRDHFYRRVRLEKDMPLSAWQAQCRAMRRYRLRVAQLRAALGYEDEKVETEYELMPDGSKAAVRQTITKFHRPPNVAMLIFLGKNMLGQSDKPERGDGSGKFGNIPNYRMIGDEDAKGQSTIHINTENDEEPKNK